MAWVVERTFAWLNQFRRLRVRYEKRADIHEAFLSLACVKREAHVLAALNHPNIATISGFEEADGVRALVLELVEGPTLNDRIAQGPSPVWSPDGSRIAFAAVRGVEFGIYQKATNGSRKEQVLVGLTEAQKFPLAPGRATAAFSCTRSGTS